MQKNTELYHNRPGEIKNQTNLHLEPYKNGYIWIDYVNIYLCHQYGISVTEAHVQSNLDYPDSLGPDEIVRIIEDPDNKKNYMNINEGQN